LQPKALFVTMNMGGAKSHLSCVISTDTNDKIQASLFFIPSSRFLVSCSTFPCWSIYPHWHSHQSLLYALCLEVILNPQNKIKCWANLYLILVCIVQVHDP
jgi:hypothetical protein